MTIRASTTEALPFDLFGLGQSFCAGFYLALKRKCGNRNDQGDHQQPQQKKNWSGWSNLCQPCDFVELPVIGN